MADVLKVERFCSAITKWRISWRHGSETTPPPDRLLALSSNVILRHVLHAFLFSIIAAILAAPCMIQKTPWLAFTQENALHVP